MVQDKNNRETDEIKVSLSKMKNSLHNMEKSFKYMAYGTIFRLLLYIGFIFIIAIVLNWLFSIAIWKTCIVWLVIELVAGFFYRQEEESDRKLNKATNQIEEFNSSLDETEKILDKMNDDFDELVENLEVLTNEDLENLTIDQMVELGNSLDETLKTLDKMNDDLDELDG